LKDIVKGISLGCKDAGYALIGGETAEMPGMYKEGEYDLAGFGVGIVNRSDVINGRSVKKNDVVIGLESSGLHSNGFSLVRKVLNSKELKAYARELLKPTKLYAKSVLALKSKVNIKGIANITGGAFYDKVPRIIPKGMAIEIDKYSWRVPQMFSMIQKKGKIEDREMYRTFNMGIGMVAVVAKRDADRAVKILSANGTKAQVIGRVVKGAREVAIL
jgi:phosphoribosylformylglycinamidine cyclo-ligase